MPTDSGLVDIHRRALDAATEVVGRLCAQDLGRPTPCAGWSVGDLLGHMIGQHVGFARAVADGDAELVDFRPLPEEQLAVLIQRWHDSTRRLRAAFADTTGSEAIRLAEIHPRKLFALTDVLGMQILDTAVHTWDLAAAQGWTFQPEADILNCVERVAARVPGGDARAVGNAFAQPLSPTSPDRWNRVLAHLGRRVPPMSDEDSVDDVVLNVLAVAPAETPLSVAPLL